MLEHIVTEKVLQQAFAQYLRAYAYGSAAPNDFWRILESEMHQLQTRRDHNITNVINIWLSQSHYPTLQGFSITWINNNNNPSRKYSYLDNKENRSKIFNPETFLIFNARQLGFYRTSYTYEMWFKIIYYLNNHDFTTIPVLNRAQIIDDAYHLVLSDKMNYELFLTLVEYLRDETNFIVWHSMMNVLHYISPFLNFPESAEFKEITLDVIDEVLTTIGYDEDSKDDDKLKAMRLLLLNWACKHGHVECKKRAHHKLISHIDDPKNNTILPWWENLIYCTGLMNAKNETVLHKILNHTVQEKKERLLQHMDCIEDDHLLQKLVTLIADRSVGKWKEVEPAQLRKLYHGIVKKHARKPQVLDLILHNFDKIMQGYMTEMQGMADIIMSLYSKCYFGK
ncbi:PREDICTED: aminopeptidase N-like, partial [Dinoponera quadriceps]|uniref:Aminopeptidase N-like n=1 Tax=Dinoponera quadriceps TaxID=609295 RepID=A0A6P3YBN3_DINQU